MKEKIKPFKSDGCSVYFNENFRGCCVSHDKDYWKGGTKNQRLKSDRKLKKCVEKKGHPIQAKIMYLSVRAGGSPMFPTPFRWGFGYKYPKGYN